MCDRTAAPIVYQPTLDESRYAGVRVSLSDPCARNMVVTRDLHTGAEQTLNVLDMTEAAWSPDGRYLALGYYSNTDVGHALILDTETGRQGDIKVDDPRGWAGADGTNILGWTPQNRLAVDFYPYPDVPGTVRFTTATGSV